MIEINGCDPFDTKFYEMQTRIIRELAPELVRRIELRYNVRVRYDIECIANTVNVILYDINGRYLQEFACHIDQFKAPNWMPVYRRG